MKPNHQGDTLMEFEERLAIAHQLLADSGLKEFHYNPWLFKLLRKLGVRVKSPYYAGWLTNFLCSGLSIAPLWGLIMWTFVWHPEGRDLLSALFNTAMFAGVFGLFTLIGLWLKRRQLGLTPWEQLEHLHISEGTAEEG